MLALLLQTFVASCGTISATGTWTAPASPATCTVTASQPGRAPVSVTLTAVQAAPDVVVQNRDSLALAQCLSGGSRTLTLSADKGKARFDNRSTPYEPNLRVDARAVSWVDKGSFAVDVAHDGGMRWCGGTVLGNWPDTTAWTVFHGQAAFYNVVGASPTITGVRVDDYGDGIRWGAAVERWAVTDGLFSRIRDDFMENDRLTSGRVDNVMVTGAHVVFSMRPDQDWTGISGVGDTVTITNSLFRLVAYPTVYKGAVPGHGGFFKMCPVLADCPKLVLRNNVFRADQLPNYNDLGFPNIASCSGNTVVWLGPGSYPNSLPSCFTLTRDVTVWTRAEAAWKAAHPRLAAIQPAPSRSDALRSEVPWFLPQDGTVPSDDGTVLVASGDPPRIEPAPVEAR